MFVSLRVYLHKTVHAFVHLVVCLAFFSGKMLTAKHTSKTYSGSTGTSQSIRRTHYEEPQCGWECHPLVPANFKCESKCSLKNKMRTNFWMRVPERVQKAGAVRKLSKSIDCYLAAVARFSTLAKHVEHVQCCLDAFEPFLWPAPVAVR